MPAALPLSTEISQASSASTEFRILRSQYGNGYDQRVADGINSTKQTWSAQWDNLNSTDFSTLITAFDTAKGVDYFTWTPPGSGSSKKFIVLSYSITAKSGTIYDVSASLEQVFDLT
jgi:phage-related protein